MSLLEYALIIASLWIVFPFSIIQMKVALNREDINSFSMWVFITCFVAGLPFMIMTLATAS